MSLGDNGRRRMFARSRPIMECVQCDACLYVPEWSEYVEPDRIRHLWRCEQCGTSFETVTPFEAA